MCHLHKVRPLRGVFRFREHPLIGVGRRCKPLHGSTSDVFFAYVVVADARREGARLTHTRLWARGSSLEPGADAFGRVHGSLLDEHIVLASVVLRSVELSRGPSGQEE